MATCKDCLYYDVCKNVNGVFAYTFTNRNDVENHCEYFKDRSKFIELPCKINEICAVRRKNYIGREVHERAILKGVAFVVHNSMGNLYIFPENVMTIESMIKLEAEKALEEREQE